MGHDVETVKESSRQLRGTVAAELTDDSPAFSADSGQLLKFHGIYQQDDRDRRRELTRAGGQLAYSCMVRCSVPGGVLRPAQWRAIDDLAGQVGGGSLRLTTRQGVQYHFVHKGDLKPLVATLNRSLVTTYAACGDVVRNVMVTSAPHRGRELDRLESMARALSNRFRPHSAAYWELWLDGERAVSAAPITLDDEPIYGRSYLPRKFKVGIAAAGDNSIDVYSQDVGLVLSPHPDGRAGVVVLVGGGLGRNHRDDTTHPRLADPLAWVPDDEVADVVEAVVTVFRDHGNRDDRSHARLKYLIDERGLDWLRHEVEHRLARPLADPLPLPAWNEARHHLGWHPQGDGRWFLGLPIASGRLSDDEDSQPRAAIRAILDGHATEIRLTPTQDVLLCGIAADARGDVEAILDKHGVATAETLSANQRTAMACPALPTCGQALGEAERVLPQVVDTLDSLLAGHGLGEVAIETRMTGCPNGCARPYVAELGIVGRTKTRYDLFAGGDRAGTRLAVPLAESVRLDELGSTLAPVLDAFGADRRAGEGFGDWVDRTGIETVMTHLPSAVTRPSSAATTSAVVTSVDGAADGAPVVISR